MKVRLRIMAKANIAVLTLDQYINIIKTIKNGGPRFRANDKIATVLILEAVLGLGLRDILELTQKSIIDNGNGFQLTTLKKTGRRRKTRFVPNEIKLYIDNYCKKHHIEPDVPLFTYSDNCIPGYLAKVTNYLDYNINITTKSFQSLRATIDEQDILHYSLMLIQIPVISKRDQREALKLPSTRWQTNDHLGNVYSSRTQMLAYYGISENCYSYRKSKGWSLERILTTPPYAIPHDTDTYCFDHLGNPYPSKKAMLEAYGISDALYKSRLNHGWSLEQTLTEPKVDNVYYDHLGNAFPSASAMYKHYGVSRQLVSLRKKKGWPLERILSQNETNNNGKPRKTIDHQGIIFSSTTEMCKYYGINTATYYSRLNRGLTLEQILTTPINIRRPYAKCKPLMN